MRRFEFDRADFRTILFGLGAALRDLVVALIARDAISIAVKEIDPRPEKIGRIGFELRGGKEAGEGFDDGFQCERRGVGTRAGDVDRDRPRMGDSYEGVVRRDDGRMLTPRR